MTISHPKRDVRAQLNYWKPVEYRNIVTDLTKPDGVAEYEKQSHNGSKTYEVTINDVRGQERDFTLDKNGFEYVDHAVPELDQCKNEQEITDYLRFVTKDLIKKHLNASRIEVLTSRIRSKSSTDPNKFQNYQGPALGVHTDFTPVGAMKQFENVIPDPEERKKLLEENRIYIINIWRPLKTIERDPLAVCESSTVKWDRDWIKRRYIRPNNDWFELGNPMWNEEHKWYWMSYQQPNEALLFTQFDSDYMDEGGRTTAHTAFVDPESTEGPPRESMEIKVFAFVPKA